MSDISYVVSMNIKDLRKERQLTLQELSDLSNVSTSMLGSIERGDTNPTITTLDKIATGFKVPLSHIIEENKKRILYVESNERTPYKIESGYNVLTTFSYDKHYGFQILEIQVEPHCERYSQGHNKGVVEFLIVHKNSVRLEIDNKMFELNEGDAIRFEADKPHKLINLTEEHAGITNIIYYNRT